MKLFDKYNRVHDYLRISLTEKCNYNCIYCNPNNLVNLSDKSELLTYEELLRLIEFFASKFDFHKFRFTGGEPLVRKGIFDFFKEVKKIQDKYNFSTGITTNGSLLKQKAHILKESGIQNLNISLDSINKHKFNSITLNDELDKILDNIEECIEVGFNSIKINTVIIKDINDDEILQFVEHFKNKNVNLRFIEFMPFGSNEWKKNGFLSSAIIKDKIESNFILNELKNHKNSVSKDFKLNNHPAKISFISSISDHFCNSCNRVRISPKGKLRVCLFSEGDHNVNFKELFRQNLSDDEILQLINSAICKKWEKHPEPEELAKLNENNMMSIGG